MYLPPLSVQAWTAEQQYDIWWSLANIQFVEGFTYQNWDPTANIGLIGYLGHLILSSYAAFVYKK